MQALRRVTRTDERESKFIQQMAIQTHMAHQANQISDDVRRGLLIVLHRCHVGLMIRSGIVERDRQRYFERRSKKWKISTQFDAFVAVAVIALFAAYLWLL